jgi:hypothetical protein
LRGKLTFANVMSVVAVFISLGGVGYAATKLPKNSVGTRQLKVGAVTGSKVRDGSLTGADIAESTLGTVPSAATAASAGHAGSADSANHADSADSAGHATSADSATHATTADSATSATHATSADSATHATTADSAANADELGGITASGYLGAGAIQRLESGPLTQGDEVQLMSAGDLTLRATCAEGGIPETVASVDAKSSGFSPTIDRAAIAEGSAAANSFSVEPSFGSVYALGSPTNEKVGVAWLVYRDNAHTVTATLRVRVSNEGGGSCSVAGTAVVS